MLSVMFLGYGLVVGWDGGDDTVSRAFRGIRVHDFSIVASTVVYRSQCFRVSSLIIPTCL